MIVDLKFKEQVYFQGRNGTFKASGVVVNSMEKHVRLTPLTSKGTVGNAFLEIPKESIPELLALLTAATSE